MRTCVDCQKPLPYPKPVLVDGVPGGVPLSICLPCEEQRVEAGIL